MATVTEALASGLCHHRPRLRRGSCDGQRRHPQRFGRREATPQRLQRREATQTPVTTPVPTPTPSWLSLSGTTWNFISVSHNGSESETTWGFLAPVEGQIMSKGRCYHNEDQCPGTTWMQNGTWVRISWLGGSVILEGTRSGNSMEGLGYHINVTNGRPWKWTATLQ
jgi:hypothetical protein